MLMSECLGGQKENILAAAGVLASLVPGDLACLDWLWLVWRLVRYSTAVEWSPMAVAPNWTRERESIKGGRTPTARQDKVKSLMKQKVYQSVSGSVHIMTII